MVAPAGGCPVRPTWWREPHRLITIRRRRSVIVSDPTGQRKCIRAFRCTCSCPARPGNLPPSIRSCCVGDRLRRCRCRHPGGSQGSASRLVSIRLPGCRGDRCRRVGRTHPVGWRVCSSCAPRGAYALTMQHLSGVSGPEVTVRRPPRVTQRGGHVIAHPDLLQSRMPNDRRDAHDR